MEKELLTQMITQGAFGALFVWLLFYVLKENAKRENASAQREQKYQELLEKLTHNYDCITKDVCEIKDLLIKKRSDAIEHHLERV
jgi:phage tail tape-measure protein